MTSDIWWDDTLISDGWGKVQVVLVVVSCKLVSTCLASDTSVRCKSIVPTPINCCLKHLMHQKLIYLTMWRLYTNFSTEDYLLNVTMLSPILCSGTKPHTKINKHNKSLCWVTISTGWPKEMINDRSIDNSYTPKRIICYVLKKSILYTRKKKPA
jgi:hypothetical protein